MSPRCSCFSLSLAGALRKPCPAQKTCNASSDSWPRSPRKRPRYVRCRTPAINTLWTDPYTSKIVVGQFSRQEGADPRLNTVSRTPPAFDGKWMWVDGNGEPQPKPALFVGLFRADNPYLEQLQTTYKDLALAMRKGTCNTCHVPDNPEKLKRLVLLQTPAHAAAEIKRMMAAGRDKRMPLDDIGIEKELDAATKALILRIGAAFESTVNAAYAWQRGD